MSASPSVTPSRPVKPLPSSSTPTANGGGIRTKLSSRPFTAVLAPTTTANDGPVNYRHLKRVHVAAEVLKACKICAGDVVVLRSMQDVDRDGLGLERLSLEETDVKGKGREMGRFAVGVAWPDWTIGGNTLQVSPILLENALLSLDATICLTTESTSALLIHPCTALTLSLPPSTASPSLFEAYAREVARDISYVKPGDVLRFTFNGSERELRVAKCAPENGEADAGRQTVWKVNRATKVTFVTEKEVDKAEGKRKAANGPTVEEMDPWRDCGGLEGPMEMLKELVEWPLTKPEMFKHFNLRPPRGILLHGPPGTGKTLLASTLARATSSTLFVLDSSLSSPFHGEPEAKLRAIFAEAKEAAPSLIVIDEIDALAPNREEGGEVDRRVVAALLTLMDGLDDKDGVEEPARVVVLAATNRPNAIDPALRRPGRFDKEIEIGVPDAAARLSILNVLLRRVPHSLTTDDLLNLSSTTHGFVGADLSSLISTASLLAMKRCTLSTLPASKTLLTLADIQQSLLSTRPSALREVFLETPKVLWSEIGGQTFVKERLRECVEWPLLHGETFKRLGVKPPKGVLLYGPPGCSKTLIAKALATEGGLNFMAVKGPEIFNKYVGESERAVRELFRKARAAAPSIIFLDEVDSLAPARGSDDSGGATSDRVLMSLLTEMDGIEELQGVMVLAATNRPDVIDPALMRPGRLDRILYVAPPDEAARREIFRVNFTKMEIDPSVSIDELAALTDGCSGAEIVSVCQDAALMTMKHDLEAPFVRKEDLESAARGVRRRITREMVRGYEQWRDGSGLRSA